MRCEDLQVELSAWIDGELSAGDRARIAAHLQSCRECSEHVRGLQEISSLLRALTVPRAPASITQAAMSQVSPMARQASSARPRRHFSFAWPMPALSIGFVGLAATIALTVFIGRPEQAKLLGPNGDSGRLGAASAAGPVPNDAGYHLSSVPDSAAGTPAITSGYDFRGSQSRRDVGAFNARERFAWDHGVWRHERRFGRDGWWWDVAGAWYWYDKPANGPPAIVSDVRFAADSAGLGSTRQPPADAAVPPPPR